MGPGYRFFSFLWRQSWARSRYGRWIYKRLCDCGPAPDVPFVTDFFGLQYAGNLRNTIDFNIFYFGAFEKPLLFFLRDCLLGLERDATVFCDVGANIGQHSLFMSLYADQVHAFEPYEKVRIRLERQCTLNQLTNIRVYPVGLSASNETLPFYAPTGRNEGIGSFDQETRSKGNRSIGNLQLVNGDAYLTAQGIGQVDLLKIDVEGFEKPVLSGLRETLCRCRPVIVCELTYGNALSFQSLQELTDSLPEDYVLYTFAVRKADGSKARRRNARSKRSGYYRLIRFENLLPSGQDNIVAVPAEEELNLPREYARSH